jgi:DNA-binding LytR/AlgR family response regulator
MGQNSLPSLHWLNVQTDRIFLQSDIRMRMVRATEITFIKAEGNYTNVHVGGNTAMFIRRGMANAATCIRILAHASLTCMR